MLFSKTDLKKLIIPLIIDQILMLSVGLADSVMVARVGEAAISAVSLVDTISILIIWVFPALGTGGAVVAAQCIGNASIGKAREAAKQLILVTVLLSAFILAACLVLNNVLLRLIFGSIDSDVMSGAQTYFFYCALSYPFIALYNAGAAIFRAAGDSKTPTIYSAAMNGINIVLNAVFIFICGWGVAGAGLATLIGRAFACIATLFSLTKDKHTLYIDSYLRIKWNSSCIKKILAIGIPSGLDQGVFQIGRILLQSLVASFGTVSIAAFVVASSVNMLMLIPASAINLAIITVAGQCIGAGDYDQTRHYTKKLVKLCYLSLIILGAAVMTSSPLLLRLFALSAETSTLAIKCMFIHAIFSILIWPLSFTLPGMLRAANDAQFVMIVSIASMWIFRYLLSFVFGRFMGLGLIGVWLAMGVDWFVR